MFIIHLKKALGCEAYLPSIPWVAPTDSSNSLDRYRSSTQLPFSEVRESTVIHAKGTWFDLITGRNLARVARKLSHRVTSVALVTIWYFAVPQKLVNDTACFR